MELFQAYLFQCEYYLILRNTLSCSFSGMYLERGGGGGGLGHLPFISKIVSSTASKTFSSWFESSPHVKILLSSFATRTVLPKEHGKNCTVISLFLRCQPSVEGEGGGRRTRRKPTIERLFILFSHEDKVRLCTVLTVCTSAPNQFPNHC